MPGDPATQRSRVERVRARLAIGGWAVRMLTRASLSAPRATLLAWLAFAAVSSFAALGLRIDTSTSSFLDVRGEGWATYQRSLERHGGDEFVAVVLKTRDPLDPETLGRLMTLTDALEGVDGVARVDSLARVALIRASEEGGVDLSAPLERGVPRDEVARAALGRALQADLIAPGALISRDERALALNVVLDEDVLGDREVVVGEIERVAGPDALVSGVPVFRTRINADTRRETLLITPVTVSLMALLLGLALRSGLGASLPLLVGGVGTTAAVGLLGVTGTPLSLSTMILPSVLLALGCAYGMHVVTAAAGAAGPSDLGTKLENVAVTVALSGLTTTLGFLAISTTPIDAVRELSLFGAYGVLVVTTASVSLIPAVLALRPGGLPATATHDWIRRVLAARLAGLATRHPGLVIAGWSAIALASLLGLGALTVSTDIIRWYAPDSEIRAEYAEIRGALSGISPVSLFVEARGARGVTEPEVVERLDRLAQILEARDDVGKVLGIGHPLRMMDAAMRGGSPELPRTRAEIEQYLLLLEGEEPIWDVIARDHRSARLALRVDDNGSGAILDIARFAEDWWRAQGPPDFEARATGIMLEFAREQAAIVRTQITGLLVALAGVGLVLVVVMRGVRGALLALVPNLIPLAAAYGFMGAFGAPLDAATACLGSLALGIAVDDTIHVAASWSRERDRNADVQRALQSSLAAVLPALLLSSLAIGAGFAVLGLSDFVLIRNLGLITAGVVLLCWAADVTLLPVLLGRAAPGAPPDASSPSP